MLSSHGRVFVVLVGLCSCATTVVDTPSRSDGNSNGEQGGASGSAGSTAGVAGSGAGRGGSSAASGGSAGRGGTGGAAAGSAGKGGSAGSGVSGGAGSGGFAGSAGSAGQGGNAGSSGSGGTTGGSTFETECESDDDCTEGDCYCCSSNENLCRCSDNCNEPGDCGSETCVENAFCGPLGFCG